MGMGRTCRGKVLNSNQGALAFPTGVFPTLTMAFPDCFPPNKMVTSLTLSHSGR